MAGPVWPGRAVADPVGRVTPPQTGRGRRGCGPLVATGPPLRPGAAGWASGIPAGSPLPRGPFWPSPFLRGSTPRRFRYSPSGEASFPWGRAEAGPPPRQRRGPLGVESPRVSRSALSQATWWPVRAPQGVRGPPLQPFPSYSGSLPRSHAMVFTGPSPVDAGYCAELLPMANARPSSPPPRLRTTRGAVPPLERGTRCLPAVTPVLSRFFCLSPYEVPKLGVRPARDSRAGPQAGQLGEEWEFHPPLFGLAIVRPGLCFPRWQGLQISLSPLSCHHDLSTGRRRTRHGAMGSPHPAGGIRTPFPTLSP